MYASGTTPGGGSLKNAIIASNSRRLPSAAIAAVAHRRVYRTPERAMSSRNATNAARARASSGDPLLFFSKPSASLLASPPTPRAKTSVTEERPSRAAFFAD